MSRRHLARGSFDSRPAAALAVSHQKSEFAEFQQLLGDIRLNLSQMSGTYDEPSKCGFQHTYAHRRPYRSPAVVEAEALYRLVQTGKDTLDSVRGLIAVPLHLEAHVKDLQYSDPDDQRRLLASLRFRKQVLKEFEHLVKKEHSPAVAEGVSSGNL